MMLDLAIDNRTYLVYKSTLLEHCPFKRCMSLRIKIAYLKLTYIMYFIICSIAHFKRSNIVHLSYYMMFPPDKIV